MTKEDYMRAVWCAKADVRPVMPAAKKCCASCEWLSHEGRCEMFGQYPPLDYIKVESDCSEYTEEIPF